MEEGHWVQIENDYFGYLQSLPGNARWIFNTSRGLNDRWIINFTISGIGFNPTTVLVCNASVYESWLQTSQTHHCLLATPINSSLNAIVDFPYLSQWFFVLNNTSPVTLYFSLRIIHYLWINESTTTPSTDFPTSISSLFSNILLLCILVVVIVPCLCNFSCLSLFRRRSRKRIETEKIYHNQTAIVIITPEQLEQIIQDEENQK